MKRQFIGMVLLALFVWIPSALAAPCDTDDFACCTDWENRQCVNWTTYSPTGNYGCDIGYFKGVAAKSNDGHIGTGCGRWQCVEYIKRFYLDAMGINLWEPIGIARNYWDEYEDTANYGYLQNSGLQKCANDFTRQLKPGDILVFNTYPYGHVAIVTDVKENSNQVSIIEQNYRADDYPERSLLLQTQNGKHRIDDDSILGWLHMPVGEFANDEYLRNGIFIQKGWHFNSDIQGQSDHYNLNSRPFTVCYQANGGRDMFGAPINLVHRFPDEDSPYGIDNPYNNMRHAWVQDFQNGSLTYTLVINEYVYNVNEGYLGVAYYLEGPIRNYFFNHYWEIGYPVTNMYRYAGDSSSDPPRYVVQWFERLDNEYYVVIYDTWTGSVWHESEDVTGVPMDNFNQHQEQNSTPIYEGCGSSEQPIPPPDTSCSLNNTVICQDVDASNSYIYVDETDNFFNSDGQVYAWIELTDVCAAVNIVWKWYNPNNELEFEWSEATNAPATGEYFGWYRLWSYYDISTENHYGEWSVKIFIDDVLANTSHFFLNLNLETPTGLTAEVNTEGGVVLDWTGVESAINYNVYRNHNLIATAETTQYIDTAAEPGVTYNYQIQAKNGSFESNLSDSAIILISNELQPPYNLQIQ